MTQLTFSSNFYWKSCFKFYILEQIIATVLFICISSINAQISINNGPTLTEGGLPVLEQGPRGWRNSRRRRRSVQVSKLFYLRCLLRSKISAAQKSEANVWYFQRNCFIFNVKILKEVRFPESSLILLQIRLIRFAWNNGGQKHTLSFDVRCPVSGQFFICRTESMN